MSYPPIPHGHTRIYVQLGEAFFPMELPSDQIYDCIESMEHAVSGHVDLQALRYTPAGSSLVREIAHAAAGEGHSILVCQAALWIFLHPCHPDLRIQRRGGLQDLVEQQGGALIVAICSGYQRGWTFHMHPPGLADHGDAALPLAGIPEGVSAQ